MHTLLIMSQKDTVPYMMAMTRAAARQYKKACYISFNNSYNFVLDMLGQAVPGINMFVVVDSSPNAKEVKTVDKETFIVPVTELFKVYLFLHQLVTEHHIQYLLIDSLSALIKHHSDLPLKEMMTTLLLETGKWGCDSTVAVEEKDQENEVVKHIMPLIKKQTYL